MKPPGPTVVPPSFDTLTLPAGHIADRITDIRDFNRCLVQTGNSRFTHGFVIEKTKRPKPVCVGYFPSQKEVVGYVQIIRQRERLKHGFNAGFTGIQRSGKINLFAVQ